MSENELKECKIKTFQKRSVANHACIVAESDKVVAIAVDLNIKWTEIVGTGYNDGPLVCISADEIDDTIEFPEFKGWDVAITRLMILYFPRKTHEYQPKDRETTYLGSKLCQESCSRSD